MGSVADRRAGARTEILLRVEYRDPGGLLFDYLSNLGAGGIFIRTDIPFEVGRELSFAISFPGLLDPVQLKGVVRWRRTAQQTYLEPAGVGIEFVFDNEEERESLSRLLARVRGEDRHEIDHPFRVLLVEDNDFVQEIFQHALRRFMAGRDAPELEVTTASDAPEAMKCIANQEFDLAIIDHYLPTMNGARLVQMLRNDERFARMPILMVSVGGDEVREEATRAGADGYLGKPVLLKQLVETLRRLAPRTVRTGNS